MTSEAVVQQQARQEHYTATAGAGQLWRNNNGACTDETGRLIRYGLGHEYPRKDDDPRSSDLVGITPTLITPAMVGYWLGVYTEYEVKPSGWKLLPSDHRGHGQAKWHGLVRAACGYAGFVTDPRDIYGIIGRG